MVLKFKYFVRALVKRHPGIKHMFYRGNKIWITSSSAYELNKTYERGRSRAKMFSRIN